MEEGKFSPPVTETSFAQRAVHETPDPYHRLASVPVGVGVGLWTAQLTTGRISQCPPKAICLEMLYLKPTFATWQCILFGAGAAAVLLLLSLAASRLPSAAPLKAS